MFPSPPSDSRNEREKEEEKCEENMVEKNKKQDQISVDIGVVPEEGEENEDVLGENIEISKEAIIRKYHRKTEYRLWSPEVNLSLQNER